MSQPECAVARSATEIPDELEPVELTEVGYELSLVDVELETPSCPTPGPAGSTCARRGCARSTSRARDDIIEQSGVWAAALGIEVLEDRVPPQ
ncbi:MAG: hypothetical protein ACR2NR_00070 [Solirubrobacteraceae bacterium]